jgi:AcrR family transcriptional regulator
LAGVTEAGVEPRAESPETFAKLSPGPGRSPTAVADHQRARIHNAIIEIAGERGYDAITIREISRLASVSSRAFYEHYSSKQECFLRTHETIVRGVARSIVAAQADQLGWRNRLRATFAAFIAELEQDPRVARLLLVEAYSVGPESLGQVRRAERTFETRIAACFGGDEDGLQMPSLLVKAMTFGTICLTRSQLLEGREGGVTGLAEDLNKWALSLCRDSAMGIMELGQSASDVSREAETRQVLAGKDGYRPGELLADRARIAHAVSKLVLSDGYQGLTVPSACLAAGVSRRRFNVHYADIDECFVDAAEFHLAEAFAAAEEAAVRVDGAGWDRAVQSSLVSLCHAIATDEALRKLGFSEALYPGSSGLALCGRNVERIRELIATAAPESLPAASVIADASAGAIWGLLAHLASDAGRWHPSRAGRALTFLALAPVAISDLPAPSG